MNFIVLGHLEKLFSKKLESGQVHVKCHAHMQCCATARSTHDAQKFSAKFIHFWLAYDLYGHLVSVRGSIVQRGVTITVGRKGTIAIQVSKKMSDTTV